jgi:hypothetical protein
MIISFYKITDVKPLNEKPEDISLDDEYIVTMKLFGFERMFRGKHGESWRSYPDGHQLGRCSWAFMTIDEKLWKHYKECERKRIAKRWIDEAY